MPAPLRGRLLPGVVLIMITAQLINNYDRPGARTSGTSWSREVAVARAGCAAGKLGRIAGPYHGITQPLLTSPTSVKIPVAPWGNYFWSVRLPCNKLD